MGLTGREAGPTRCSPLNIFHQTGTPRAKNLDRKIRPDNLHMINRFGYTSIKKNLLHFVATYKEKVNTKIQNGTRLFVTHQSRLIFYFATF